jgi:hypothetical protein
LPSPGGIGIESKSAVEQDARRSVVADEGVDRAKNRQDGRIVAAQFRGALIGREDGGQPPLNAIVSH